MIRYKTEEVAEMLREKGLTPTNPRVCIYKYLLEHKTHPTVDKIYYDTLRDIMHLSKTTVYNVLRLFAEKGLCKLLTINERVLVFDIVTEPHAHILCKECGKVYDVPQECSQIPPTTIPGFVVEGVEVNYRGICPDCNYRLKKKQEQPIEQ